MLQCTAVSCNAALRGSILQQQTDPAKRRCTLLQCAVVRCSVLQRYSAFQCVAATHTPDKNKQSLPQQHHINYLRTILHSTSIPNTLRARTPHPILPHTTSAASTSTRNIQHTQP
jgi:hypothetical protein